MTSLNKREHEVNFDLVEEEDDALLVDVKEEEPHQEEDYPFQMSDLSAQTEALINSIQILFMGFNPPESQIPTALSWLYYISAPRYGLAVLAATVFADCPVPGGQELGCQVITQGPPQLGNATTIKAYVETNFNMVHDEIWTNLGVVIGFIIVYRTLGLLCLRYVNHQKR